jgi:Acetyltransferase (GNAT) domain
VRFHILTSGEADEWRRELDRLADGDVYFLPEFHRACELNGDGEARAFVFEEGRDRLFHPFLIRSIERVGGEVLSGRLYDIESVVGYTGPLATTVDSGFLGGAWSAFGDWCRSQGVVAEFVRFNPISGNERFVDDSYAVTCDRPVVALRLDCSAEELWQRYPSVQRNMVRKAELGGLVAEELAAESLASFQRLYEQTMSRQAGSVPHVASGAYLAHLRDSLANGFQLFGVQARGKLVAAGSFLLHGDRIHYHLAGRAEGNQHGGAGNLLLHSVALWGQARGFRWLHLGGGRTRRADDELLRFKASISRLRLGYRLGRRVHDPDAYEHLCLTWRRQSGDAELPAHTFPYRVQPFAADERR